MLRGSNGVARYFGRPSTGALRPATVPRDLRRSIRDLPNGRRVLELRDGGSESYDETGRLVQVTDRTGNETILTYEAGTGRLMQIRDLRGGRLLRFVYAGNQILLRGPADKLLATYDLVNGLLTKVTYPEGDGYQFGYDATTQELLTVHDLDGKPIETHAYEDGRAVLSEIADGRERYSIAYEPFKAIVTDARQNVTTYHWANFGGMKRITKVTGGCAGCGGGDESREWTYYDDGQVRTSRDGEGNITRYTYDLQTGEVATVTVDPDPSTPQTVETTINTYWPDGRIKSRQDPKGGLAEWTHVAAGPETITEKISQTESRQTRFSYYPSIDPRRGKLHTITDPRQKVTTLDYHPEGDLKSVRHPLGYVTTYQYDTLGRRRQVVLPPTDPPTSERQTYYDTRGRLRFVVDPGGTVDENAGTCTKCTAFTYDNGGRLVSRVDALGHRTTYEYDPYARLERVRQWVSPTTAHTTTYGYDLMSNLEFVRDARGKETRFEYDTFNRVEKVKYPGDSPTDVREETVTYDGTGHVQNRTDRRNVVTT
jgi:large repetitive protein